MYSKVANPGDVHITFPEWIPLICSVLGMLMYVVAHFTRSWLLGRREREREEWRLMCVCVCVALPQNQLD